jgi:hypothetical protein
MIERFDCALRLRQDVYSGNLKLLGEESVHTLGVAICYASMLQCLKRFEEAKLVLRKTLPVARRVLGESNDITLRIKWTEAWGLYKDAGATLGDLREAVKTLEEIERTARHVCGGAHPLVVRIEFCLKEARAALHARETPPPRSAS